ncbi:MAG: hypothetical protein HN731_12415, partial [Rhodospirillaceae bacterium]|nr:hypothetical protein [Rhodospirillaceae bacterium]
MTSFNAEEMLPSSNQPVNNSSPAACDGIMESNIQPEKLSDVIDALAALLRDSVDIHRCSAARALGEIKSDQATEVLIEALLDEDEDVRTDAAEALAVIGDKRASQQLLENLIGDPCSEVKMAAVGALTKMKTTEVIPWLKRLLKSHDEEIAWDEDEFYEGGWDSWVDLQIAAIKALAEFGAEDAVPEIVTAINDEDAQDLTEFAFAAFARMGAAGAGALVNFLGDKDSRRRRRAAVVLAGIDHDAARKAVLHALKDPAKDVRLAIAGALSTKNFNDQVCEILLADQEPELRAIAISRVDEDDVAQLKSWLDDPAGEVQIAVLKRLLTIQGVKTDDDLNDKLQALISDGKPSVVSIALEAFAALFDEAASETLLEVLADQEQSEAVRLGALRGLKKIATEEAVSAIGQTLTAPDRQIRFDAIAALGELAVSKETADQARDILIAALNAEITPLPEEPEEQKQSLAPYEEEVEGESSEEIADEGTGEELSEEQEEDQDEEFPTSTWGAIMGTDGPKEGRMAELSESKKNRIHLTDTDMEMLALSAQTPRKGRVRLAEETPAFKDVPQFAARVLGEVPGDDVASALALNIENGNAQVRLAALDSLVQIGESMGALPKDAVAALMRVVANSERDCRLLAVRALGAAKAADCAGFLAHRLEDGD